MNEFPNADRRREYFETLPSSLVTKVQPSNTSGIRPTEHKVLIEPVAVEERTPGGIIKPDMARDHEKYSRMRGRLVACSPLAFSYARPDEWQGQEPKPGDLVLYAKYAGRNEKGKDGKEYTLCNDEDIAAVLEE